MSTKRSSDPANVAYLVGFLVTAWRLQLSEVASACGVQRGNLSAFVHSLGHHRNVSMARLSDLTFDVLRCHSNGVLAAGVHCWAIAQSKWLSGGLRAVLAANVPLAGSGGSVEFVRTGDGLSSAGTLVIRSSEIVMAVACVDPDAVDTVENIVREFRDERGRHGLNGIATRRANAAEGVRMRDAWMEIRCFGIQESPEIVRPVLDVVDVIRLRASVADKQVSPASIS